MRAILIDNPGPDSRLVICEQPRPICGANQLLIKVKATALNRADILQRQGKYPPPTGESNIPGLEVAGEIVAIGSEVRQFKIGDPVYGLVAGGGYAEYCCLEQNLATLIPNNWDYAYAAAIPEALMTAYATIFAIGQLKKDETLLIHGAGSSISCFAIQMAKTINAQIITTAGSAIKIKAAEQLGANKAINYHRSDFSQELATSSIDLIVDFIGGDYFSNHLKLLKEQGKLVQIACMKGHLAECNLALLMKKRLQIFGFVLRSQSLVEKARMWKEMHQQWFNALVIKSIKPIIDSEFNFTEIEEAHERMISSAHFGKIVVRM